jgi:hypothetical protein
MSNNARVQEGETASEDPRQLLVEFDRVTAELTGLVRGKLRGAGAGITRQPISVTNQGKRAT